VAAVPADPIRTALTAPPAPPSAPAAVGDSAAVALGVAVVVALLLVRPTGVNGAAAGGVRRRCAGRQVRPAAINPQHMAPASSHECSLAGYLPSRT
jgi:hypothetical protein